MTFDDGLILRSSGLWASRKSIRRNHSWAESPQYPNLERKRDLGTLRLPPGLWLIPNPCTRKIDERFMIVGMLVPYGTLRIKKK